MYSGKWHRLKKWKKQLTVDDKNEMTNLEKSLFLGFFKVIYAFFTLELPSVHVLSGGKTAEDDGWWKYMDLGISGYLRSTYVCFRIVLPQFKLDGLIRRVAWAVDFYL